MKTLGGEITSRDTTVHNLDISPTSRLIEAEGEAKTVDRSWSTHFWKANLASQVEAGLYLPVVEDSQRNLEVGVIRGLLGIKQTTSLK